MSTNFYARLDTCDCCGRPREEIHIGKRSGAGDGKTAFTFKVNSQYYGEDIMQLIGFLTRPNSHVIDEYGREYTFSKFLEEVLLTRDMSLDTWVDYEFF